jgi:hypothetical protein
MTPEERVAKWKEVFEKYINNLYGRGQISAAEQAVMVVGIASDSLITS